MTCNAEHQSCVQALQPLFSPEEEPGTKDNAAGAVSRMVLALGPHLPLEQVRVPPSASHSLPPKCAPMSFSLFLSYHCNADPFGSFALSRSACYMHRDNRYHRYPPCMYASTSLPR